MTIKKQTEMIQKPEAPKNSQSPLQKEEKQTMTTPSTPLAKAPKAAPDNRQTPLWIAILLTCLIEVPQGIEAWISLTQRLPQLDNIHHPSETIWKKDSNSPKN
jgi:hypothetical protein